MQSLADYHKIDPDVFAKTGAFDPVLSIDTRLFIDPRLLAITTVPEFKESYARVGKHFEDVMRVVKRIGKENDPFWKAADKLLTFPEVKGLCIGYASSGSGGSGMGFDLRHDLLENIIKIVAAGVDDPVIFELVGIFQDKVGADRISDMIAKIIIEDLVAFTQRVCSDCGIPMECMTLAKGMMQEDLPKNPFTGDPIILVPKEILSNLPEAAYYGDIASVANYNEQLRLEINAKIGGALSTIALAEKKKILRETFVHHPDVLKEIIKTYINSVAEFYNFYNDPSGEVIWYRASKSAVEEYPLDLKLNKNPSLDEVENIVIQICTRFQTLVEDNQLAKLLYDEKGKAKHESAAQLLFFGIASTYCLVNNLDISPESDAGRGPVDFKFSNGAKGKVLVEIKLTSNNQLQHGFESQLPIYMKAEGSIRGVYLVIDNGGCSDGRMKKFIECVNSASKNAPRVVLVDGSVKKSASKADA